MSSYRFHHAYVTIVPYDTGLPDFSWDNTPKWENRYQMTTTFTKWPYSTANSHKIHQMAIKYAKYFRSKALKYVYPNLNIWYANIPFGNPSTYVTHHSLEFTCCWGTCLGTFWHSWRGTCLGTYVGKVRKF
jgi:hypothetical protein